MWRLSKSIAVLALLIAINETQASEVAVLCDYNNIDSYNFGTGMKTLLQENQITADLINTVITADYHLTEYDAMVICIDVQSIDEEIFLQEKLPPMLVFKEQWPIRYSKIPNPWGYEVRCVPEDKITPIPCCDDVPTVFKEPYEILVPDSITYLMVKLYQDLTGSIAGINSSQQLDILAIRPGVRCYCPLMAAFMPSYEIYSSYNIYIGACSPWENLTEDGKKLFYNCIHYLMNYSETGLAIESSSWQYLKLQQR